MQDHAVDIPPSSRHPRVPPTQIVEPPSSHQPAQHKSQGLLLYSRQFWGLFVKRALSAKRDRLAVIMQLLVPILLVLLALRAGKASSSLVQEPSLVISRFAEPHSSSSCALSAQTALALPICLIRLADHM